jgi:drug/metabolite transporter (DMT)-like permease
MSRPPSDLARGAALMTVATFLFTAMAALVQIAAERLPNTMVVFFRNAVALAFVAPLALRGGVGQLRTGRFPEHLLRSMAGLAAMYCFFYAAAHLRLADAVLLNYTVPLFIPLIEAVWLGERSLSARLWGPLALGFAGVLLVLKPGLGLYQRVSLIGLTAGLFGAVAQTGIRRMTATEPTVRIVFYFAFLGTLVSAVPLAGSWVPLDGRLVAVAVAIGATAIVAQLLMTRAYAYAPAAQVGAFIYSGVPFAILLDWLRRGRLPDPAALVGSLCICAAGVAMLRLNRAPLRAEK